MSNIVDIQYEKDRFFLKNTQYELEKNTDSFKFIFHLEQKNYQTIYGLLQEGHLYEADVSNFMLRTINKSDTVVDIGANVGFYTMLLSSLTKETGKVIAFEPSEKNVAQIKENQSINGFTNIDIRQKLLGNKNSKEVYYHFSNTDSGTSYARENIPDDKREYEKKVVFTLDEELKNISAIKLVKIDVEGFEVKVLKGAQDLLSSNRVRYWVVEYIPTTYAEAGESIDTLREYMKQFNLDMFVLDYQRGFPKHYPYDLNFAGRWVINLLFAKMDELAKDWVYDDTTKLCSPPKYW